MSKSFLLFTFYCGTGFFVFIFETIEDGDLFFRSGPYFMGSRGLFLSHCTLAFNPDMEIFTTLVWIRLPCLPLLFWGEDCFKTFENKLGHYIIHPTSKGNLFTYARMCGHGLCKGTAGGDSTKPRGLVPSPSPRLWTGSFQMQHLPWLWALCQKLPQSIEISAFAQYW